MPARGGRVRRIGDVAATDTGDSCSQREGEGEGEGEGERERTALPAAGTQTAMIQPRYVVYIYVFACILLIEN